ncbi:hypothetical protein DJ70_04785, partial [Halorubrum halodurans]
MMPAIGNAVDSVRRTVSTVTTRVVEVATTLLAGLALAGWSLFWSRVGRMHYAQGDLVSAAFTTAVFVLPAIGAVLWYVARS